MRALLIEDSERFAEFLKQGLVEESYSVDVATDGVSGLARAKSGDYDIVLLDINLPGLDGMTLVRELRRERSDVPVVMITARDSVEDRIAGLDGGADDYLVKPFAFEELLARMRALLRRPGARSQPVLKFKDIELDPGKGIARRAGRQLPLSAREFALLHALIARQGQVISRRELFESVWNGKQDGGSNILEVYINYLRNKLEDFGLDRVIFTVRNKGYVLGDAPAS